MATLNTLVLQLVAKVEPFTKGLATAEARFAKFQKGLVGKAGTALFGVTALDKGFDALGQAMKRSVENGENFVDVLQETATNALTTIPIIGGLNQAFISLRDYLLGDAAELAAMNERLATVQSRLGLTAKETERLKRKTQELADAHAAHAKKIDDARTLVNQLATDYANLGKSAAQLREEEIRSILTRAGAVESWIQEQIAIQRAIDAYKELQEEQRRLADEAARIFDMTRTPLENFTKEVEKLRDLFNRGLIDEDTFNRRMKQLEEELKQAEELNKVEDKPVEKRKPSSDFQSPAAIERRFGAGMPTGVAAAPELKTAKNTEQMLVDGRRRTSIQQQQLALLKDIRDRQPEVFGGNN